MIKEKSKNNQFVLADVQSVFYQIINSSSGVLEDKRFLEAERAKEKVVDSNGQVVKVTKRILETMEMELVR